jgi:hypothetical protein
MSTAGKENAGQEECAVLSEVLVVITRFLWGEPHPPNIYSLTSAAYWRFERVHRANQSRLRHIGAEQRLPQETARGLPSHGACIDRLLEILKYGVLCVVCKRRRCFSHQNLIYDPFVGTCSQREDPHMRTIRDRVLVLTRPADKIEKVGEHKGIDAPVTVSLTCIHGGRMCHRFSPPRLISLAQPRC